MSGRDKRILFDLNHPADFHFFKHTLSKLKDHGYFIKVIARKKECLQDLLDDYDIAFINRGRGSNSKVGKYIYGLFILLLIILELIKYRPGLTISLSSPYLALSSKLFGIPTITYDDTDDNPRLHPMLRKSTYILSPAGYLHTFHKNHFHIQAFKELAYLHPRYFNLGQAGEGVFFRLTRTDSIHHSFDSIIDVKSVIKHINTYSNHRPSCLSSEIEFNTELSNEIQYANRLRIHEDLKKCKVFWGNSPTMAAEAAVLGIPAIYIGAEKFAYIRELEKYGLLFHFSPLQLPESFKKLDDLLSGTSNDQFNKARQKLLAEKIDITEFLFWFIQNIPESARLMRLNPDSHLRFRS